MEILFTILHFVLLTAAFLVLVCSLLKLAKRDKPALESTCRGASWVMAICAAITLVSSISLVFLYWYGGASVFTTPFYGWELNSEDHFWLILAVTLLPLWLCLLPAIRQIRGVPWLTALICVFILALSLASNFQ